MRFISPVDRADNDSIVGPNDVSIRDASAVTPAMGTTGMPKSGGEYALAVYGGVQG